MVDTWPPIALLQRILSAAVTTRDRSPYALGFHSAVCRRYLYGNSLMGTLPPEWSALTSLYGLCVTRSFSVYGLFPQRG